MTIHPDLSQFLINNPGAVVEQVAKDYGITTRAVVHAMPETMRKLVAGKHFIAAMQDIGEWGDVTVIVHTEDGVMEFGGPVAAGNVSHGYYNVPGSKGCFHGHLRHDRCVEIAFVERPFMGKLSASIMFINVDDGIMFKVFVGRDENRELKADQFERFRALATKLSAAA